jgi:TIR domain-containing protein
MPTSHPKGTPRTGLCQQSNRSAARRNGNWKMAPRDRRPKPAEKPKIAGQRLGRASLTRGNVGDSHTPGNSTRETRLPGCTQRIRTQNCNLELSHAHIRDEESCVPQPRQTGHRQRSEPIERLVVHLQATQPVSAWVDSGQIEAGTNFAAAIENGVHDAAVLALVTSNYSSRTWCRREILFDIRSFPYIGNVSMVAWSHGGAQRSVDLLLKEQLRHLHVRKLLESSREPGDFVLPAPPELTTITSLPTGGKVLYPDPPLGDEEVEVLKALDHRIETLCSEQPRP